MHKVSGNKKIKNYNEFLFCPLTGCSTRSCSFSLHHWGRRRAKSRAVCRKISARRRRRNCSLGAKADWKEASCCELWSQQLSRLSRCDSSFLSGFSAGRILCLPRSTDTDTAGGELTAAETGKCVNAVSFVFKQFQPDHVLSWLSMTVFIQLTESYVSGRWSSLWATFVSECCWPGCGWPPCWSADNGEKVRRTNNFLLFFEGESDV